MHGETATAPLGETQVKPTQPTMQAWQQGVELVTLLFFCIHFAQITSSFTLSEDSFMTSWTQRQGNHEVEINPSYLLRSCLKT